SQLGAGTEQFPEPGSYASHHGKESTPAQLTTDQQAASRAVTVPLVRFANRFANPPTSSSTVEPSDPRGLIRAPAVELAVMLVEGEDPARCLRRASITRPRDESQKSACWSRCSAAWWSPWEAADAPGSVSAAC